MPLTIGTCPPERLKVVIADDCPAMRKGLAHLLADECDFALINSAATSAELRAVVARQPPHVLVMDLMLGDADGLALLKDLLVLAPKLAIVVFTQQPADVYAERCLRAGARAFMAKRDSVHALFMAIREAAAGGMVMPPGISSRMMGAPVNGDQAATGVASSLTNRELQVLRMVGQVQPTRLIAQKLGVSVKTVETHREHIKNKLGLDTHAELVARAAQWLRENGGS